MYFGANYIEQKKRAKKMEIEEVRNKEEEAGEFLMEYFTKVLSEKINIVLELLR